MQRKNKKNFLDKAAFSSYQLFASDLANIKTHYQRKNRLFIVNGETEVGQSIIASNKDIMRARINDYQNDEINYATYIKEHWALPVKDTLCNGNYSIANRFLLVQIEKIRIKIREFLTGKDEIRNDLNYQDLVKLNAICLNLECKAALERNINEYIQILKTRLDDICLDTHQSLYEIELIRESLQEDEVVGYVNTNNHRIERGHFEVLIITKNETIKPLHWVSACNIPVNSPELKQVYYTRVDSTLLSILKGGTGWLFPSPQADSYACGTLGLLYLKELLKDNARQFKAFTLRFPYYDKTQTLSYYFIPSPHVLRYSQSSCYNRVIEALLQDTESVEILRKSESAGYDQDTYSVTTIKKLLQDSIPIAISQARIDIAITMEKYLAELPAFRNKWLQEYRNSMERREVMNKDEVNRYLVYCTRRMEGLNEIEPEKSAHSHQIYKIG